MRQCPSCGQLNADDSRFCQGCGMELQGAGLGVPSVPGAAGPRMAIPVSPVQSVTTYLVPSILLTIFCCFPFGLAATVYAAMATGFLRSGNLEAASMKAKTAKTLFWIGLGLGLAFWIVYILVIGLAALSES